MGISPLAGKRKIEAGTAGTVKRESHVSFEKELQGVNLLGDAFSAFNDASGALKEYYGHLEQRVSELDRDLAEKSAALEKSLRESSRMERYQVNILKSLPSGVVVMDGAGTVTTFNRRAEEITGCSTREAIGKNIGEVLHGIELSSGCLRSTMEKEFSFLSQAGVKQILKVSISPLVNESGQKEGTVFILHDFTRERMLEKSLERGKRLAVMGEMAARLAHEIRNPLGGIELIASNLKKNLSDNLWGRKMAEDICGGVASLNHVITNMLQFARVEKPGMEEISLGDAIDNALMSALYLIEGSAIEIRKDLVASQDRAMGNMEMIRQAFLNIIMNSIQAMEDGGTLYLSMVNEDNDKIKIKFEDTGKGMPAAVRESAFEPFYSTRESGSGLGLAIVHNIIDVHKGSVAIKSEEGKGTAVTVLLDKKRQ